MAKKVTRKKNFLRLQEMVKGMNLPSIIRVTVIEQPRKKVLV